MSRHLDDVLTRYNQLKVLRHRVDTELADLSREIERLLGVTPNRHHLRGRPRKPITFSIGELREFHRLYSRGVRTESVLEGERQYNRFQRQRRLQRTGS